MLPKLIQFSNLQEQDLTSTNLQKAIIVSLKFILEYSVLQFCFLIIQLLAPSSIFTLGQEQCQPAQCRDSGPIIRFPFWLKGHQPEQCGFPGFALSCTPSNNTEFEVQTLVRGSVENILFPIPVKALIRDINYQQQLVHTISVKSSVCLPKQLPSVNSSFAPEFLVVDEFSGYTLFNCSADEKLSIRVGGYPVPCLSSNGYRIQAIQSVYSVSDFDSKTCRKMYNISYVPNEFFGPQEFRTNPSVDIHWPQPYCGNCEREGNYCRLRANSPNSETECYGVREDTGGSQSKKELSLGVVIGLCIFLVFL